VSRVPTVARFNVTPVKSTALHHPDRIRLDERGAAGDRRFFFVDGFGKRFSGATKAPILPIRAVYDETADTLELRLPNGIVVFGTAEPARSTSTVARWPRTSSAATSARR
jgi:uncharacterized protein YcbX